MPMIQSFTTAWSRSFDYRGKSTRADFWWFQLADIIVFLVLSALATATAESVPGLSALPVVYAIAQILPHLPLSIRRLRDSGKPMAMVFHPACALYWWHLVDRAVLPAFDPRLNDQRPCAR